MRDVVAEWIYPIADGASRSSPEELVNGVSVALCTYKRAASLVRLLNSILAQEKQPDQCVIVDASPDDATEMAVRKFIAEREPIFRIVYQRVQGSLKGLTRQRNVALRLVNRDVVVFFDDDVVLDSVCLLEMERAVRAPNVSGVGACNRNELDAPPFRWRLLRFIGGVPNLVPGSYHRCGLSIPLSLVPTQEDTVEVDRLCGNAMAWKTEMARALEFADHFHGYSQSEDVEFSRRAARHGKLLICNRAKVDHFHEKNGRPSLMPLGRMGVLNRYYVHQTTLSNRTWQDVVRFAYSNACYELIIGLSHWRENGLAKAASYWWGSLLGAVDIARGRFSQERIGAGVLRVGKISAEGAVKE